MWSFRTVATCVLLMVTAAAGPATELMVDNDSHNKTLYHKPQLRDSVAPKLRASKARFYDPEKPLSKMSCLNDKFWTVDKLPEKKVDPKWNDKSDCFYKKRQSMRPYPRVGDSRDFCYFMDFSPRRMAAWWNFWPEIRGDLQYAFDFVMWDEYEQYHETNSFWYLMLYLKTLLKTIPNPHDVAHGGHRKFNSRRRGNESMLRAMKNDGFDAIDDKHEPLRVLLTKYERKLKHLESLMAHP